ncbi:hypothetical protein PR202_ga16084 [Eleusine coracana subsp. coracana]|uniref:Protein kinase domain-containing protein n=1 Tax=Eleusine coracana subsp. coracana TaxID=191504 RepID=A0AAV5CLU5_ELECO|nr:hypothetical protein PR202_ga16084 [Eleusine coracana subsp. coracana]
MARHPEIVDHTGDEPHDNDRRSGSSAGNHAWLPQMDLCSGHFGIANTTDPSVFLLLLVSLPGRPGDQLVHHPGSKRDANRTAPWTSVPLEQGTYGVPQAREDPVLSYPFSSDLSLDVGLYSLSNSSLLSPPIIEIEDRKSNQHLEDEAPTLYGVVLCRADDNGSFIESFFQDGRRYMRKISTYMESVRAAQPRKLLGGHGTNLHGHDQQKQKQVLGCKKEHAISAAAIAIGVAFLALICTVAGLLFRCRRKMLENGRHIRHAGLCPSGPRRYRHCELAAATHGFSEQGKIGRGGFGSVYQGYLPDKDCHVAIKVLSQESSVQGVKEFESEVKVMSRLRHRNIVQLLGWCDGPKDLSLVYEFMSNGSLDKHLYDNPWRILSWSERYNIALGVGSAMLYLHTECEQCVVHGDIKPANIMLNSSFQAKVGDFGLARLLEHGADSQTTQVVAGTIGYIDPELVNNRRRSAKSDVYSFGILLLEIACGRRLSSSKAVLSNGASVHLLNWVRYMYQQNSILEVADRRLDGEFHEHQMNRVLVTGLWCAHRDQSQRPSIAQAMDVLRREEAELPIFGPEVDNRYEVPSLEERAFVELSGEGSRCEDSPAETEYHTFEGSI